jgi:hypothetical protein
VRGRAQAAVPSQTQRPRTHWLTTNEMAALVDVHPKTLLKYAKAKRISGEFLTQLGRQYRWRADFAQRPIFLDVPTGSPALVPLSQAVPSPSARPLTGIRRPRLP